MKQIEVKDFSYITFRALLQYGHSGMLTFAPLSSTFRKATLPRLQKLVKSETDGKSRIRITRLNAAAIEHASSTFGPLKAISASPSRFTCTRCAANLTSLQKVCIG